MKATTKLRVAISLLALAAGGVLLVHGVAQAQQTDRAKQIGKRIFCMCNCGQILTACNHVGCTVSASMLKKLDQLVARGEADDLIVQSFVQEFGPPVDAEPPSKGISRIAWYVPGIALLAGFAIVLLIVVRWRRRPAPEAPSVSGDVLARARERADLETNE